MKLFKLLSAVGSTLVLTLVAATAAQAAEPVPHQTLVSGFEIQATSTRGTFVGTASGTGSNGIWGGWTIQVEHTSLGSCTAPSMSFCAHITGGTFSLAETSPVTQLVTGNFDNPDQAGGANPPVENGIALWNTGRCANEVYWITDGLNGVGTGSRHAGWGTFTATLTHYRHMFFGSCVTYTATVKGTVSLSF